MAAPDFHRELTHAVIGCMIEVHRVLGPGLLEAVYEECLAVEMDLQRIPYRRQAQMPMSYKGRDLAEMYRLDFVVDGALVLELKAVDALKPIHEAQLLTYLRLTGCKVGLLVNFNSPILKDSIRRLVN